MAQSTKNRFWNYARIFGVVLVLGVMFWSFGIFSYETFEEVGVYTKTSRETIRACSYIPICFPVLMALTVIIFYFVNRKNRTIQSVTISVALLFGAILYPLILRTESSTFLSQQVVYSGSCTIAKADIIGENENKHVALAIECANGKDLVDTTPALIAFIINNPDKPLECKLSPINTLDCGQFK